MDTSSGPWNPAPASISSPPLLLPIPAIVFIAVGVYLLLLGLVLLTRHCLLAQGCCTDCSSPCRKQTASETQDCCWSCAEACDFPLPSPAHYLDACCPHPSEAVLREVAFFVCVRYPPDYRAFLPPCKDGAPPHSLLPYDHFNCTSHLAMCPCLNLEGWAPRCPQCCPLCDCACACQLPDCQSLNCLCFEIKLR